MEAAGFAVWPQTTFEADGPVTIVLPEEIDDNEDIELVDPEGLPLAVVLTAHARAGEAGRDGAAERLVRVRDRQ